MSGLQERDWRESLRVLRQHWPAVGDEVFKTGWLTDAHRPRVLVPNQPFDPSLWQEQAGRTALSVRLLIPIYPDTVSQDIDWREIKWLQSLAYDRPLPRTHEKVLPTRLKTYDLYRQHRSFKKVSRQMEIPRTTVKHHFMMACRDIIGAVPAGSIKERRAFDFDPQHVAQCARCSRADSVEQFCGTGQAFVKQVEIGWPNFIPLNEKISRVRLTGGGKRKPPLPTAE